MATCRRNCHGIRWREGAETVHLTGLTKCNISGNENTSQAIVGSGQTEKTDKTQGVIRQGLNLGLAFQFSFINIF